MLLMLKIRLQTESSQSVRSVIITRIQAGYLLTS